MKFDEYKKKENAILIEAHKKKRALQRKYALSNNTFKIGDIVTDHIGSVRVEKILFYYDQVPSCVYVGIQITKKGKPVKSGEKRNAYQINLVGDKP